MADEKVLIIDDNEDFCQFMKMLLENEGYTAYTSHSGEEGLQIAHEFFPDCIILDYLIPYVSGVEIARQIKADPVLRTIPVIFLTANDNKEALLEGINSGADDYVIKANDFDIINARIKAMLRMKKLQDENMLYTSMLRRDILYAAKIQNAILHHGHTSIPSAEIIEMYTPYTEVAGDYYDIKQLDDKHYAIVMADVAGHGVAASMLTIFVKSYFENNALDNNGVIVEPKEFLTELNHLFVSEQFDDSFFTTLFYGLYNNDTGEFRYSRGGHPVPLYFNAKEKTTQELYVKGMLIGVLDEARYETKTTVIEKGDAFLIFTDGIFEVFRDNVEIYGEERLRRIFHREMSKKTDVKKIPDIIVDEVKSFAKTTELEDDVTLLLLYRTK